MKRYQSILRATILFFALLIAVPFASAKHNSSAELLTVAKSKNPIGVWVYQAEGMEPEYSTGVFFIREENGKNVVEMQLEHGTLIGQDVVVSDTMIKFNVNIKGLERVSFVLLIEGNTIVGETSSTKGIHKISGTRKLAPQ